MLDQNDNHDRIIADVWGQYDRYKLASPPDNEPQEEGDGDWTADFEGAEDEHLWPDENEEY